MNFRAFKDKCLLHSCILITIFLQDIIQYINFLYIKSFDDVIINADLRSIIALNNKLYIIALNNKLYILGDNDKSSDIKHIYEIDIPNITSIHTTWNDIFVKNNIDQYDISKKSSIRSDGISGFKVLKNKQIYDGYSIKISDLNIKLSHGIESNGFIVLQDFIRCFVVNSAGQLGLGDRFTYYQISTFSHSDITPNNIVKIKCKRNHTLILTTESLYGCGINEIGQLGIGECDRIIIPHKINISNIIDFDTGKYHTLILTKDGLYGCGSCWSCALSKNEFTCIKTP